MPLRARLLAAAGLVLACGLGGCDRKPNAVRTPAVAPAARLAAAKIAAPEPPPGWFTQSAAQGGALNLAYTHDVGLLVSGGAITAHFDAARDRCLNTPALHCILLRADFSTVGTGVPVLHEGSLSLRLPHDQIAAFAESLAAPLPGEPGGLVSVIRQSMSAEDLSQPVADVGQRVAQLQSYLASLKSLGERLTIGVGDLVRIAAETARTQTEIEAAQAAQRSLSQRVTTEELDIGFTEPTPPPPLATPIQESVAAARATFDRNVAWALDAGIAAIPWLPLAFLGLLMLWFMRFLLVGQRRR